MADQASENQATIGAADASAAEGRPRAIDHAETAYSSNSLRLSARDWLIVAVLVAAGLIAAPQAWRAHETLPDGGDRRVPYQLSNDYWLFARYARQAAEDHRTLVVGDSVVWGHYVRQDQTLTHDLNVLAAGDAESPAGPDGPRRFANLGVDGIHPAAMVGLVRYFGQAIAGRDVVLHCNLLWTSSDRHDLTTRKEFSFNHATLVPQFSPPVPCYRAPVSERLAIAVRRDLEHEAFAQHLRLAYFDRQDLPAWTIGHPYDNPLAAMARPLPSGGPAASPAADAAAWMQRGIQPFHAPWVELDRSFQWACFLRTLEALRGAGNRVFVVVGPFNEHMLDEESRTVYRRRLAEVQVRLKAAGVPYYVPDPLPSDLYADASHPLPAGYELLARRLYDSEAFARFLGRRGTSRGAAAANQPEGDAR